MFGSDFLSTDLFKSNVHDFTVWFILSIFCFACGWIINKTLGWIHGGKVVFSVAVAVGIISVLMVSIFRDYFGVNDLLTENLILYSLRNITLGAMALFGMAIAEMFTLQRESESLKVKQKNYHELSKDAEKKAGLILDDAKLKAERIIFDADKKVAEMISKKSNIETQLKELIRTEKELLDKYDKEEE
jgi:hypothetical protein